VLLVLVSPAGADVPDPSLHAVEHHLVRLELDGAPAQTGRVIGFDAVTVTISVAPDNEVVTVPRAQLARVILVDDQPAAGPERPRMISAQFGIPGTLMVDYDRELFHAFSSANVLAPILTASSHPWIAASVGAGVSIPLSPTTHWKFDVFGQVLPLHITSFYTYLAFGVGAGFHYTAASGFSVGITLPVIGASRRLGSSPYGYDAPYRYSDSLGNYYLAAFIGMPLVTFGYRFPARCASPRSIAK
jgi:hypothetical protein